MRITEVKIEKFRSIKEASFHLNDITAIVGENNAGKTAILRAINAVLNFEYESSSFVNRNHQYAARNNTYITLTFEDIPEKELYSNKTIDQRLIIRFSYKYRENKHKYEVVRGHDAETLSDDFIVSLSKDLKYVYVPAGRTNKDISWSENSILHELTTKYAAQYTVNRDTITRHVKNATSKIHDTILRKVEDRINELYMQQKTVDFSVDFPQDLDYTFLLDRIELSLNEEGNSYNLREWGSGTKSLAVIAMHRALALLEECSVVLGIEEPETNLHPQAQKSLIMSLKNLQTRETQALFTTHSTVLIDELQHDDILLVRRIKDERRGFRTKVTQLPQNFWQENGIDDFKHYQYFGYKNSDFFFSRYVVIGESKNDCQVFERLLEPELNGNIVNISFLDAGGVENIKYPYFLLKALEIPFTVVVDHDFFFPYLHNNELEESRDEKTGLPLYANEIKDNAVINSVLDSEEKKQELRTAHMGGYRKMFHYLKQYHFLVMQYCLEMDLSCSEKARDIFYDKVNLSKEEDKTQRYILVKCKNAIKKIGTIMDVLDAIPKTSYPESFSKIRTAIKEDVIQYL